MISKEKLKEFTNLCRKLRQHIIAMTCAAGSGHPGGSLSAVEILVALYFHILRHNPKDPGWEDRDRFVMSKGHAAPVLYATLAEAGYFPVAYLKTLRKIGSSLQGHVDMLMLPGIEMSTGSLGQGLSTANGMALAGKLDKKNYRVYVLLGDGECHEGQVWEAAMTAGHHQLDNVTAIIDHNQYQIDGKVEEIKGIQPLADKWRAFRWEVLSCEGHNLVALVETLEKAAKIKGKPTMIIAETIKGKGVSFMEEHPLEYHGRAPTAEEEQKALAELCHLPEFEV